MTFEEWWKGYSAGGTGYEVQYARAGWMAAMNEAWKICQDIDDRGEWGESAGVCASAIVKRCEPQHGESK